MSAGRRAALLEIRTVQEVSLLTVQLSFLLSHYFFILHSVVGTSKSRNAGLWLIHHLGFLSRGLVLKCVFGWASRQLSLLLLVSVNKGGLFSQHPRGLFLVSHYHYWFFFLSFPQQMSRQCFGVWRSNDLMIFRECLSLITFHSFFFFLYLTQTYIHCSFEQLFCTFPLCGNWIINFLLLL